MTEVTHTVLSPEDQDVRSWGRNWSEYPPATAWEENNQDLTNNIIEK